MLAKILAHKRAEIAQAKKKYTQSDLESFVAEQGEVRGFADALRARVSKQQPAIIAEIKRASPSKGLLCEDFEPIQIANTYMRSGACCLSVLTDVHFFKGSGAILDLVRRHCMLPVLRKDFIIDPYQVYESRAIGADAVLLIVAAVADDGLLQELFMLIRQSNMDVLVEVHNQAELDRALLLGDELELIGINNRDLGTFEVSLDTSVHLAKHIPPGKLLISESGISDREDIETLQRGGIYVYLIGEALMVADDPAAVLRTLIGS